MNSYLHFRTSRTTVVRKCTVTSVFNLMAQSPAWLFVILTWSNPWVTLNKNIKARCSWNIWNQKNDSSKWKRNRSQFHHKKLSKHGYRCIWATFLERRWKSRKPIFKYFLIQWLWMIYWHNFYRINHKSYQIQLGTKSNNSPLTPREQRAFRTPLFPFGLKCKSLLRRHVMIKNYFIRNQIQS